MNCCSQKSFVFLPLLLATLPSCRALPGPISSFPKEIRTIQIVPKDEELVPFEFLSASSPRTGHISHTITEKGTINGGTLELVCEKSFSPSRMCQEMELKCQTRAGQNSFKLAIREDGRLRIHLGPPWDPTPTDLVEVDLLSLQNFDPREGLAFNSQYQGQLVEGVVDSQTLHNRASPKQPSSAWFNQLDISEARIFISIHEAHPHFLQVASTLAFAAKAWLASSPHFSDCGFTSASN